MDERIKERFEKWNKDKDDILDLSNLGLNELPPIPDDCSELDCSDNNLTFLPELPNCTTLICYNNKLTSLPKLPNCFELGCSENQLTSLPDLPKCKILYCRQNKLRSLPNLPICFCLDMRNNKITSLPDLPNVWQFRCYGNDFLYIPSRLYFKLRGYLADVDKPLLINYPIFATKIQRVYKNHIRKKYYSELHKIYIKNVSSLISSFI